MHLLSQILEVFCLLFHLVGLIGFATNLSIIKESSKGRKRKFFDFNLTTANAEERCVCFTPER